MCGLQRVCVVVVVVLLGGNGTFSLKGMISPQTLSPCSSENCSSFWGGCIRCMKETEVKVCYLWVGTVVDMSLVCDCSC